MKTETNYKCRIFKEMYHIERNILSINTRINIPHMFYMFYIYIYKMFYMFYIYLYELK